jgi:hypothetical protein
MKRLGRTCAGLLLALGLVGCEPDDGEVRGELEVTPSDSDLTGGTKGVVLTAEVGDGAEPIVYPLEWSVAFAHVGRIASQSANKAAYLHISTNAGGNVVSVRDRLGREGLAVVNWEPAEGEEGGGE